MALAPISRSGAQDAQTPLPRRPFQSENWNLAWQTFIQSGAVNDAYALALGAVKARPHSRVWWERLAQAAMWSGHPQTALDAQTRLAIEFGDKSYLEPALKLSLQLENDPQSLRLLRAAMRAGLATPAQLRMRADLYMANGETDRAIRALRNEYHHHPDPELLWQQATILRQMGEPQKALAVLRDYRKRYGPSPRVMLAIATGEYLQGRPQAALDALLQARARAKPAQTEYWSTLSDLAWMLGRYRLAAQSAEVLLDRGKADAALYLRVVYVEQYTHPRKAFAIALRGWKATHDPALFQSMLSIASGQQPPTAWLARAFAALTPQQARSFADQPGYWTGLAMLRAAQGRYGDALSAYRKALRLAPRDNDILAGYLWLHLDHDHAAGLRTSLGRLARRAHAAPALWGPLAALYAALDQPQRALPWLQAAWPQHRHDPLWLVNYADVLAQADRNDAAWQARRRALDLIEREAGKRPAAPADHSADLRIAHARLLAALRPGDAARRGLQALARDDTSRPARVAVLGGLLDARDASLARWWRGHAFAHDQAPDWAVLSQALADNDRTILARLLRGDPDRLPRRDRVDAASRLGWDSQALSLAWQGLSGEPDDAQLHRQFRDLSVPRADSIGFGTALVDGGGLRSIPTKLGVRDWASPHDRLDLDAEIAPQRSSNRAQLGVPPASRKSLVLGWTRLYTRGQLDLTLGTGRNLAPWSRLGVSWKQRWTDALDSTLGAVRGAQASQTVPLSVAGLEDRIDADAGLALTPRDTANLQLTAARLRAQGGGALGSMQKADLNLVHKLWFTPPDFSIEGSLSAARYQPASRLPAQLASLVPAAQTPGIGYFVPVSYTQACVGGSFNMQYQTGYAAQWRPFARAFGCSNSAYGLGYELQAGMALPVAGPDHLSLSFSLGRSVGPRSGSYASIMLDYRYYFPSLR